MQQLELFKTKDQEERLKNEIDRYNKRQSDRERHYTKSLELIRSEFMTEGKNYKLEGTGKWITIDKEFDFGGWRERGLTEVVKVKAFDGAIKFLYARYNKYDNAIEECSASVDMENGKFNCHGLQRNYRYIKPSTMHNKLVESRSIAKNQFDRANKYNKTVISAIEKLQSKFPKAKISRSNWDDNITIEFKNGNNVTYSVWSDGTLSEKRCYIKTIQMLRGDDKLKMLQSL